MLIYEVHSYGADGKLLDAKLGRGIGVKAAEAPGTCLFISETCGSFISAP